MKIRTKLLILLLTIALGPLLISAGLNRISMLRLGSDLAGEIREGLNERAVESLQSLVVNYEKILQSDRNALETAVNLQAREVERRLAASSPPQRPIFFSADFESGPSSPPDLVPSGKHFRIEPDGKIHPVPVSYSEQVFFLVKGTARDDVLPVLIRLATMPEAYRFIYNRRPSLMYWQYTSLEDGIHSSYPGHGGYPSDYDPRKREWYKKTKNAGALIWSIMAEVSTHVPTLTVSVPVYGPDGAFAGATAIDVRFEDVFQELNLPGSWSQQAAIMLVAFDKKNERLRVVVRHNKKNYEHAWQEPLKPEYLEFESRNGLEKLIDAGGKPGVFRMPYQGKDAFWTFGAREMQQLFPLVIVPYETIIAQSIEAERYVIDKTVEGIEVTALIFFGAIIVVTGIVIFSSRRVARPLRQMAEAARRLSQGDFGVRVDIRTGDELQELGNAFNDMGPKLAEREQMKHSLILARGIQQHLLPKEVPSLEGFELAGQSVYCDETGGDFYDFLDLVEMGPDRLGLAVGDITGHGIAAALLMAEARGVLRSKAQRFGPDLSKLFQSLNNHLVRDVGEARFMTLFYGILDGKSRSLQWNSAGHGPVFWLRHQKGKIGELRTTGIPLGIFQGEEYPPAGPIKLQSGDIVLIGTDGIWEATNSQGEVFGVPRLREILISHAYKSAGELHSTIMNAVHEFLADESSDDDITLMVIKTL